MFDPDYRLLIPSIPESGFDRAALALLDMLLDMPTGALGAIRFDDQLCPPGTALIEALGCCWDFGNGPTAVIERLSLGTANAWRTDWICEPDTPLASESGSESVASEAVTMRSGFRPWTVRRPDVGLSVFPTTIDFVLQGEAETTTIPAGTPVGRISYSPGGQRAFDPGNLTYAVAHVFRGFEMILSCIEAAESRRLAMPQFFLGDAPEKRMCLFLKHFDLDILDGGDLGATVIAPVSRVHASLDRNRSRWERIADRADRISIPIIEPRRP